MLFLKQSDNYFLKFRGHIVTLLLYDLVLNNKTILVLLCEQKLDNTFLCQSLRELLENCCTSLQNRCVHTTFFVSKCCLIIKFTFNTKLTVIIIIGKKSHNNIKEIIAPFYYLMNIDQYWNKFEKSQCNTSNERILIHHIHTLRTK